MNLISGVLKEDYSDYVLYFVESLSDELKQEIRSRLSAVCHGVDQAQSAAKIYSYKETAKEFVKRYKSDKNASEKRKKGMIGELLVHIILEIEGRFTTASPFFNMEERSFKKGYDVALFEEKTNELWIAEVKSGEIQKNQKDASAAATGLINTAKNDLKVRLNDYNTSLWLNALNAAKVTMSDMLIADSVQHNKIRRSGKSDGRCLYNGGKIFIDDLEYHFTGGFHPRDYVKAACWENTDGYRLGESFGGNLVLFRIVWQYYQALIEEYTLYLKSNSADRNKQKLLDYIKDEWNLFLNDFKKIEPKSVKKIGREDKEWKQEEAVYNQEANTIVRKRIARLTILWSNPGDMITVEDGSEVILEGVDNKMRDSIYKEYEEAMELLGIKQMILQGPPGTSKTYSAKAFLKYMAHNCSDEELAALQIVDYFAEDKYCAKLRKEKGDPEIAWDIVQFHPSYGYEDFVRGIKVSTKPGSDTILYETVNKVLGNIAELAKKHEKTKFFLIIDEINRANLATVFGELIYGLEYRTEQVATPYSVDNNNRISIPDNLYIVGTMNTADKSIGGIDYAIRRRFLFFEQLPDIKVIEEYKAEKGSQQLELNAQACKLFENVATLFEENYLSAEYRKEDVQIGHTYFLVDSKDKLMKRFEYQIIPILKEYYKDGIINFEISDETDGFNGFLNCIAGKINMTSQRGDIENIFNDLIE